MITRITQFQGKHFVATINRHHAEPYCRATFTAMHDIQALLFETTVYSSEQAVELADLLKSCAAILRHLEEGGSVQNWKR